MCEPPVFDEVVGFTLSPTVVVSSSSSANENILF